MNSTSSAGSLRKMREHARNMQETDRTTQENAGICTTPQESTGKLMGRCMKTTSLASPAILLFPCMFVRFLAVSGAMVSHCCIFLALSRYIAAFCLKMTGESQENARNARETRKEKQAQNQYVEENARKQPRNRDRSSVRPSRKNIPPQSQT